MTDHNHIPGECPAQEESPRQRVSLEGKYCLSFSFLKVALPFYVIFLIGLSFGRDIFGDSFTDFYSGLCFGGVMLFGGIFLSARFSIWERVPQKSSATPIHQVNGGQPTPAETKLTTKD